MILSDANTASDYVTNYVTRRTCNID